MILLGQFVGINGIMYYMSVLVSPSHNGVLLNRTLVSDFPS